MPTPSLTLARRLYARRNGLRVKHIGAGCSTTVGGWSAGVFGAYSVSRSARTKRGAVRRLCRALGWKP